MDKLKSHTIHPAVSNSEEYADTVKALQEDVYSHASCSHYDSLLIVISHSRKFIGEVGRNIIDVSPLHIERAGVDRPRLEDAIYELYGEKYGHDDPDYSEILAYKCSTVEDVVAHINKALKVDREKTMAIVENFNDCDDERKTKAIFALIDITVKAVRKRRKEAMQRSIDNDANKKMDEAIAAIEEEE